jgi:APA family basic amino acid/polyamine antiporter
VIPGLLWRYASSSGLTVYTYLVDLDVVAVSIPYLFSACAQLTYLVSRRRPVQGWLLARDLLICGAAALFSMWVTFASVYQALVLVLAGIILYAFLNARRERVGQIPNRWTTRPTTRPRRRRRIRNGSEQLAKERCDDGRCSVPGG